VAQSKVFNLSTICKKRIAEIIQQYDIQGFHRTGTDVSRVSAFWLAQRIQQYGVEAILEPFPLSRIVPIQAYLQIGQHRVAGLPLFDGTFTNSDGIQGKLGLVGTDADIVVMQVTPQANTPQYQEFLECRRSGRYKGIIAIASGSYPGLTPLNAWDFTAPFGPPVLQVDSEAATWLEDSAQDGQEAVLVTQVQRDEVEDFNVIVTLKGTNPQLAPLVVLTPRSGWWHCAAERGGGLACWLSLVEVLSGQELARDVIFVATSGHELGAIGLEFFLKQHPDLVKMAKVWLHFGANIGAAFGMRCGLFASSTEFATVAARLMSEAGAAPDDCYLPSSLPYGEAVLVHRQGGSYFSLLGANGLFHHVEDRFPAAVDVALVTRLAIAFTNLALAFAVE
jgi:hypothetical protein